MTQVDPTHLVKTVTAGMVADDPDNATNEMLKRAIDHLYYQRGVLILTSRRRGLEVPAERLAKIESLISDYVSRLNRESLTAAAEDSIMSA